MSTSSRSDYSKIKEQILAETLLPGCSIPGVAKSYSVSKTTIYRWIKQYKKNHPEKQQEVEIVVDSKPKFLEVDVEESKYQVNKQIGLQKALLTFDNFSLTIEGKMSSAKLMAILNICGE